MGRHSIPGPDDTPSEPFPAIPPPERPGRTPYRAYVPFEGEPAYETAASPAPDDEHSGGHFADGSWQGGHRSTNTKRRGVSIGVIVALVAIVAFVSVVILWRFFGGVLTNRSDAAAATCSGSAVPVAVVADPSIADKIQGFANRYNKSAGPIGDRCIKLGVKPADSDDVINGFVGNWPSELGERPALWIPASSVSTSRLQAAAGSKIMTVGETANLAARLEAQAAPGEILLSAESYRRTRDWLSGKGIPAVEERLTLKGFAQPAIAFRLVAPKPANARS